MTRLLTLFLILLLAITQYRLWWGENGLLELRQVAAQVAIQEEENQRLSRRNQRLEAQVQDLKNSLDAVEERARYDLGMIGEQETFFWLVGEPPQVLELPESLDKNP
ncbi:cell division protein FtsB [Marinospirillum perlucidum]|uniref:cell division protein FtsB n=1 Tax=Marinospirillum perlucidum TaxID=1982602 RepID=UPI000DF3C9EF|nr:cell division protein FtsB [Marinospirillum perlucidum]